MNITFFLRNGTLFGAINGDLLWLFAVIDHYFDEVLGWHIVEVGQGDRFAPWNRSSKPCVAFAVVSVTTLKIQPARFANK